MKIQNRSEHVVFIDSSGISEEYNAYRLIDHSELSGEVSTLYVGWIRTHYQLAKIRFKGTKSATIAQAGIVSEQSYALKLDPAGEKFNSISVEPNQIFYVEFNANQPTDRLFTYTDEDGTSPLLRIVHHYLDAGFMAMGEYVVDGYSNGSFLNSVPDSMEDYQPDMSYFPVLEATRDFTNSSQHKYIPAEFKVPFRIKCNALLPINTIPAGETYLATVFDKLRNRIYLPFESGEYAVLDESFFPKGMPLDVGWNVEAQKLVCLYPREVVQLTLSTKEEEVLYTIADETAPDFHAMHVGTYDHYYNSFFIGVTSTKLAVRIYKKSTASSVSVRERQASETETYTYAPTSTYTYDYVIPESDAFFHSRYSSQDAYLNNKVGGYSKGIFGAEDLDGATTNTIANPPLMLNAVSHGTRSHWESTASNYDGDVSSSHFVVLQYVEGVGLTALPLAHELLHYGMSYSIWNEESLGSSIDFDTMQCKSGQTCESTSDYYRNRKFNPVLNIYAELYPDLPDRFTEFKSKYVIPELQLPVSLKGKGDAGDIVPVSVFGDATLEPTSGYYGYSSRMKISDESELSYVFTGESYDLNVTVLNRQSGEVKVPNRKLTEVTVDVETKHLITKDSTLPTYDLVMPEADDPTADFDIEIVSCVGHCQFRKVVYGIEAKDPNVVFDYIRAVRVDRFHKTNTVDMTPVTDGVIILASFPPDVKVWMNDALMLGSHTDDDGVFQEPYALQCDNKATFALEVRSPLGYDQRKVVEVSFNATVAPIVIETPPIQGMQVDGLTTKTTQKSVASVCDHHQKVTPDLATMQYSESPIVSITKSLVAAAKSPSIQTDRPLDFFKPMQETTLRNKPMVASLHEGSVDVYPSAITTMQHLQMSVLIPSKKIDYVYHPRSGTISDFSTDWIHMSSPVANKRAMNYWTHTDLQSPHLRAMNYWEVKSNPRPNLRDQNEWISLDNIYHIATSLVLRLPPYHHIYEQHTWVTDWIHEPNHTHLAQVKPWIQTVNSPNLYDIEWVKTVNFDPVFALGWVSRPERDRVVFETPWVKRSDITEYQFKSLDGNHKYLTYKFDRTSMTYTRHANLLASLYVAIYTSNFYSIDRPLNFIKRDERYTIERPLSFVHHNARYLPEMIERKLIESEGTHVVFEETPQGYFATEDEAYQAALDEGYDPEQVLIMTQQYYPNAWIFSIRFKRVGICPKAVEYGYVRGG